MDTKALNNDLIALVEKKILLSTLSYADAHYDEVEEELHNLEDAFVDKYGEFLEQALEKVHNTHKIDSDVLLPIAYLAHKYTRVGNNGDGTPMYEVSHREGVWVEAEKYPGREVRLVLVPSPTRFILSVGPKYQEEVWVAK
jgi:hypothetical protein